MTSHATRHSRKRRLIVMMAVVLSVLNAQVALAEAERKGDSSFEDVYAAMEVKLPEILGKRHERYGRLNDCIWPQGAIRYIDLKKLDAAMEAEFRFTLPERVHKRGSSPEEEVVDESILSQNLFALSLTYYYFGVVQPSEDEALKSRFFLQLFGFYVSVWRHEDALIAKDGRVVKYLSALDQVLRKASLLTGRRLSEEQVLEDLGGKFTAGTLANHLVRLSDGKDERRVKCGID